MDEVIAPKLQGMAVLLILPELMEMFLHVRLQGECSKCAIVPRCMSWIEGRNKKRSWDRRHGFAERKNRFSGIRFKEEEAMAFVQVVRRSMRPEEYTDLRAGWLKRFYMKVNMRLQILKLRMRDRRERTLMSIIRVVIAD